MKRAICLLMAMCVMALVGSSAAAQVSGPGPNVKVAEGDYSVLNGAGEDTGVTVTSINNGNQLVTSDGQDYWWNSESKRYVNGTNGTYVEFTQPNGGDYQWKHYKPGGSQIGYGSLQEQ